MRLEVAGSTAKFTLTPQDEMTHFFVVTCYTSSGQPFTNLLHVCPLFNRAGAIVNGVVPAPRPGVPTL